MAGNRPNNVPGNAGIRAIAAYQARVHADNVSEYLAAGGDRLSAREAGYRVGVDPSTIYRIRRELRAKAGTGE